jgi:hypothetical protein
MRLGLLVMRLGLVTCLGLLKMLARTLVRIVLASTGGRPAQMRVRRFPCRRRRGERLCMAREPRNLAAFDAPADQLLDRGEQRALVVRHERYGLASGAGAAGSPDAVDVILGHVRQIVVDDVRQLLDVEPPCRDVRCHQHAQLAVLEALQRSRARVLALVAVDRIRLDAAAFELFRQPVCAALGLAEHQNLVPVARAHEMREQVALAILRYRVHTLRDQFGGRIAARDLHLRRIPQERPGELANFVREGRREQQILAARRQQLENAADIRQKPHVEHPVGFVEDQDLDAAKIDRPLPRMIEQAPGRRDEDVNATAQCVDLRLHADTAEDLRGAQ